ncbi:MAG TPA: PBP1A family penicillin-binding protein [Ideonella sp.]|uniref:penicillin-binding protein 1A n=1 Tax=Ideonella sp. TaxID=1929293 RepID=UPI002E3116F0|nr:PBP1A family penicillin-binding protein [Ideonella sp.]HEX5687870.1 PBP1A family penicillin-binding protein [Ideonella sp.]
MPDPISRRQQVPASRRVQRGALRWPTWADWRGGRDWRAWALVSGITFASGLLVLGIAVALTLPNLPSLDRVTDYQPRQPLTVLTRDGVEIAQFGAERRIYLPLAQIPKSFQDAVVAVEDKRFRRHFGIDLIGVARAVVVKLGGGRWQGASTITQQVARNFFLSQRRTLERKFKEALLALKIEQALSKDEILELYLNQIYLGQRAYGFGAAARTYFGKPLDQLTQAETAVLVGLPKNPNFANPIVNLPRAQERQRVVLAVLRDQGLLSAAEHDAAREQKLSIHSQLAVEVHAEHVAEMARRAVVERFGEQAYTRGYKVVTSLVAAEQQAAWAGVRRSLIEHERRQPWRGPEDHEDLPDEDSDAGELERAAAQALKDHRDDEELRVAIVLHAAPKELKLQLASGEQVKLSGTGLRWALPALSPKAKASLAIKRGAIVRLQKLDKVGWAIAQWPAAEAAFVAMEPVSGRVRALVGGFDFARQPFNHATQAWRQPGSSFKPFLYSAALEHGVMPSTLINDTELALPDATGPTGWRPQNSDGQFDGPLTLRQALARSKNSVSIRLLQHIGIDTTRAWAANFGIDPDKQPDNLTLALGAGSTTPLQLAGAYAMLANGGWHVMPQVIERITDADGKLVYEAPAAPTLEENSRVLPARNSFITRRLLHDVVTSGTAARVHAALPRDDLYGKTGTTNDAVDAWFAGFQPGLVGVAWVGYDDPRSLGSRESGGGLALPIWLDYMRVALARVPVVADPAPEGVTQRDGEWVYSEWAEGGAVERIGFEAEASVPAASASAPPAPNAVPVFSP